MSIATITSKGRVTIPAAVRAALNLRAGDKLTFMPAGTHIIAIPVRGHHEEAVAEIIREGPEEHQQEVETPTNRRTGTV